LPRSSAPCSSPTARPTATAARSSSWPPAPETREFVNAGPRNLIPREPFGSRANFGCRSPLGVRPRPPMRGLRGAGGAPRRRRPRSASRVLAIRANEGEFNRRETHARSRKRTSCVNLPAE
jgi:hypothetical protein